MDVPKHNAMECKEVFALLSEYLDQNLSAEECEVVRRHIEDCAPCVEFLESLKGSIGLCRDLSATVRPSPLSADMRERLAAIYRQALDRH
jgi:anti-sigma factor RsiW